jgi:hypothetical protein
MTTVTKDLENITKEVTSINNTVIDQLEKAKEINLQVERFGETSKVLLQLSNRL